MTESIKGYVDHVIYRNEENGYTVLTLVSEGEELTCVGCFRKVDPGETLLLTGTFTEHNLYGKQLKVESLEGLMLEDAISMERYLGSGAIKGIGAVMAGKILKKFGEDTFRIMEEEPERLAEIKGISEKKAQEIGIQMAEKKELRSAMMFLQQYGISNSLALKIYGIYGEEVYAVLKENPYRLAEEVGGVGFKIADEIAEKMGVEKDSDYRVKSALLYMLYLATLEGHVYLPKEILVEKTAELLSVGAELPEVLLGNLAIEKKIMIKKAGEETCVYLINYYYAELNCARMLLDIDSNVDVTDVSYAEKRISILEEKMGIQPDERQHKAVLESINHGVFLLSGGPGTGKTTTINTMIQYYIECGMDILLAAPTGRAAKRMTEATGYEAVTIHRLLELAGPAPDDTSGRRARFGRNEENPLEADLIIIDEMSMVDLFLFQSLLRAVPYGARLILVGDMNQLPSVGPGQVLRDLFSSEVFHSVILQTIYRQAGESDIVKNAHRIRKGESLVLDNKSRDFFFLERNDVNIMYKHMIQLIRDKLPGYIDAESKDIQVLTPMRKGSLGVEVLNRILQEYLNPPSGGKKEHAISPEKVFREGDKVMQTKNNYRLEWEITGFHGIRIEQGVGVFNGDLGKIMEIQNFSESLVVEFDDGRKVTYPFAGLDELELAYAITIHKAQGSEYPAVILPLLSGPRLLFNRNLLYTAVTRARQCVTILGSSKTVEEMIENIQEQTRYTSLRRQIKELKEL